MNVINSFDREYDFLSNFFPSVIRWNQKDWPTVEHAFQAAKCLNEAERELIRSAASPRKAKALGRKVHLRPDWEENKEDVMRELVGLKFRQHPDLARRLLATGEAVIVEGNRYHDNVWGDCYCGLCQGVKGQNLLGQIIMQVRGELKADRSDSLHAK
jgi:ribA/ribD-fused uncharacterized protein